MNSQDKEFWKLIKYLVATKQAEIIIKNEEDNDNQNLSNINEK